MVKAAKKTVTKSTKKTATKAKSPAKKSAKATAKRSTKKSPSKKTSKPATDDLDTPVTDADMIVEVDRRDTGDRRDPQAQAEHHPERRKVTRRRQIDPTTCERDYSNDEIEFMKAMDAYKHASGRMFPTCSEILEVVRALGYSRPGDELVSATNEDAMDGSEAENLDDEDTLAAAFAGDDSDSDLD